MNVLIWRRILSARDNFLPVDSNCEHTNYSVGRLGWPATFLRVKRRSKKHAPFERARPRRWEIHFLLVIFHFAFTANEDRRSAPMSITVISHCSNIQRCHLLVARVIDVIDKTVGSAAISSVCIFTSPMQNEKRRKYFSYRTLLNLIWRNITETISENK